MRGSIGSTFGTRRSQRLSWRGSGPFWVAKDLPAAYSTPMLGAQVQVPCKVAANLLLALSSMAFSCLFYSFLTFSMAFNAFKAVFSGYFSLPEKELHQRLVQELLREKELPQEALYQLKAFEMALRLGHAAVSLGDLGGLAARWLFSLRGASGAPEARGESNFAEEVAMVARNISWHHEAEVEVGPRLGF